MTLLDGLSNVAWDKLGHAYGKAVDVPGHLRAFATGDAASRATAIESLAASLCHQGSLYSATVEAIPLLWELAAADAVADKHLVLHLLADIATRDDHVPYLLGGIREPAKWPKKKDDYVKSFLAVRDGAKAAIPLLAHPEPKTRAE